ncbi:MAG TPA: NAD(P)-dependent oxidoreductase [Methanomicrobiales archaeon]|nr:NAD(P)-dependent oxidoreductase [Methanomicrobiales archaeon]
MDRHRVAITIRSFDDRGPAMADLRRSFRITYRNTTGKRLSEDDLGKAVAGAEGVIAGTERFTGRVIGSSPDLKVISRVGVGTDSIDLAAAREHGVKVLTTPDSATQAVAEHTLALILAVMKRIGVYALAMRKGDDTAAPGSLLLGKTAGIVGLGRIGNRVAGMLDSLGCRILYLDPAPRIPARAGWEAAASFGDLLSRSDIVSLHVPAQEGDRALIDGEAIGSFKEGAVIVNTARGSLLSEDALLAGLREGRIAGAGLDVFPVEPYWGALLGFPQVVVTPHVASLTAESRREMEVEAVKNLVSVLSEVHP